MYLPSSSASLPGPGRFCAALATALISFVACGASLRADLLVLNAGGAASHIVRLDAATGTPREAFRHDTEAYYTMTLSSQNEICVSSNTLGEYSLQVFGEGRQYRGDVARNGVGLFAATRGPDGAIYALAQDQGAPAAGETFGILRIDSADTKQFVRNGTGGMAAPVTFVFGPDGDLYVADARAGILRFSGGHGASLGVFVPLGRGGLQNATKMVFGPDGHLYVADARTHSILRFDGLTGESIDTVVPPGSGGLRAPAGLAFGPDGHLYVTSGGTNQVLRFDGGTGSPLGVFAAAAGVPGDPKVRWGDLVFETPLHAAGRGPG